MQSSELNVVIVGGGFGGLNAARSLGKAGVSVTLIDRNNFHLFQPLLYQVATGFLTPGDIAGPIRTTVKRYKSVKVVLDNAVDLDAATQELITEHGRYHYDVLVIATGVTHSYFGYSDWEQNAPGLKSIDDAVHMRAKVLRAFEAAEQTHDANLRQQLLTFMVVGGGPTGVELAGALAELARRTLLGEFRNFSPADVKIHLIEGGSRILSPFHPRSSTYAEETLKKLGVTVRTNVSVVGVGDGYVELKENETVARENVGTVLWAAGVQASTFSRVLHDRLGIELDRAGRVPVQPDLSLPAHPEIFVIGDLMHLKAPDGSLLPGMAPVAIQQGRYVAKTILQRRAGRQSEPFHYFDKGMMAVIGRGRAVAQTGNLRMSGFTAWLAWALIHIYYLIEFENKFVVFFRWVWNYITNSRGSRLITSSRNPEL